MSNCLQGRKLIENTSTGITGYVGGTVFNELVTSHPDYELTAFVRSTPDNFEKNFPQVKLIHGTWDDSSKLKEAAQKADITIQCGNSDELGAVTAMLEGAASRSDGKPGYYIHLSGTGLIADFADDDHKKHRGILNEHVYNDLDGVEEVLNRPDGRMHRHTDKAIQEAAKKYDNKVKTAIVCPPDMYGKGTGPKKVDSVFVPAFISECKRVGAAWYYGAGENVRGWCHVADAARIFTSLAENAANGGGSATWGREGYYFATHQETRQKELATAFGKILHARGVLKTAEPKQVGEEVVDEALKGMGPQVGWYNFGNNSRATSGRAQKVLGWKPHEKPLWDVLESDIDSFLSNNK